MDSLFHLKHFSLKNSRAAMKITTDSILLGSWVNMDGCSNILDIGTGTGIIALMMAQRTDSACQITGIDIDRASAEEAADNFASSPWAAILSSRHCSLADFTMAADAGSFDMLVSNPPFFERSLKSPDSRRNNARHTDTLPLAELVSAACKLLCSDGKLALILPASAAASFIVDALSSGLFLSRECYVRPSENRPAKRVLLEFCKMPQKSVATSTLTIGGDEHKKQVAEYYE